MEDDRLPHDGAPTTGGAPVSAPHRPRKKWPLLLLGLMAIPLVLLGVWTVIALNWSYSRGDRAGYIQKFSKKGWVCKTWEGEIAMAPIPGAAPEKFPFTVRSDSLAAKISSLMGSQVAITYEQHVAIPGTCFGDTDYFVVDIKPVAGPGMPASGQPAVTPSAPMPLPTGAPPR